MVDHTLRAYDEELEGLTAELQKITHKVTDSLDRFGHVVDRVEEISLSVARVTSPVPQAVSSRRPAFIRGRTRPVRSSA